MFLFQVVEMVVDDRNRGGNDGGESDWFWRVSREKEFVL